MARGVFVTGTGTGVGKTLVSACLVARWGAEYWKPAQTGITTEAPDMDTVHSLTGARLHPSRHVFAAPLSVEAAAALENCRVSLADFTLPETAAPLVVEGAGGILVPLSASATMADLMLHLGLPVILVARTGLGTINHTLLSLEALRHRNIPVAGIVLSGTPNAGNRDAIARHGGAPVLGTIPLLPRVDAAAVRDASRVLPDFATVCPP